MYLSGFPAEELKRISGQKSPAAFMRYIKVDKQQVANRLKEIRNKLNKYKMILNLLFVNSIAITKN